MDLNTEKASRVDINDERLQGIVKLFHEKVRLEQACLGFRQKSEWIHPTQLWARKNCLRRDRHPVMFNWALGAVVSELARRGILLREGNAESGVLRFRRRRDADMPFPEIKAYFELHYPWGLKRVWIRSVI